MFDDEYARRVCLLVAVHNVRLPLLLLRVAGMLLLLKLHDARTHFPTETR